MLIVADSKIPRAVEAFKQFGEVSIIPTSRLTRQSVRDADAILVRSETKVDAGLLDNTSVRFVGTATIGIDHLDLVYLQQHSIGWASCPGSNANSVGEYVLAVLLELAARLDISLQNKTLGIVGHGNTGRKVEEKAAALGMRILLNDPPLARTSDASLYHSLGELMDADFISLHVPLTKNGEDPTFHLFDKKRIESMKGILINASRGAVVETSALNSLLQSGRLRACALDVWEHEPAIDVELLNLATLGTPHIAGYSYDGKLKATEMLEQALGAFFQLPCTPTDFEEKGELKEIALPEPPILLDALVREAVAQCYSVVRDDADLRRIVSYPTNERPAYFRNLRATYKTRREFSRYIVDVSGFGEETRRTFAALGFKINDLRDAA